MTNVIRPTFGRRAPAPTEPGAEPRPTYDPLRLYGEAAGFLVAVIRDVAPEGPILRIVVGPAEGSAVETVGQVPDTPETEMDADAIGYAVLRALEIVERAGKPGTGEAG